MDAPPYAELHCLTHFSFLRGASHPQELVGRAHELGYAALAITDECSVSGVVRAHVAAKERGLPLLIGAEFRLVDGLKCVVLATDRRAYGQLCRTITRGRRAAEKGSYRLERADLETGLAGCLVLLLPEGEPGRRGAQWLEDSQWLAAAFGDRGYLAVELLRDGSVCRSRRRAGGSCRAASITCASARGSRSSIPRRSSLRRSRWRSAAASRSMSCVTSIPGRSCRRGRHRSVGCGD
jgi:error-prone DNA polymerase